MYWREHEDEEDTFPRGQCFRASAGIGSCTEKRLMATKTKTATVQQEQSHADFLSVGALFASAKVEGDWRVVIDHELLDLLGVEYDSAQTYALICKQRTSKAGKPYKSLFLAISED